MHQLSVEIERLQSALSDRERELEEIAARRGRAATARRRVERRRRREQLSELEGKVAIYEIELLELRARLEDVVDREFVDLREGELKQEIERLTAHRRRADDAAGAEEQLAPLRAELAAAQDERERPRSAPPSSRPVWPRCRASSPRARPLSRRAIRRRRASCARSSRSCRSSCAASSATLPS